MNGVRRLPSVYLSIWIFLVLIFATFWKPDLHHDGLTYLSATAQAQGLRAGSDYIELYGVVSTSIEGIILKYLGNRLIFLRLVGLILNCLIAREIVLIARNWLPEGTSSFCGLSWLAMNPVLTLQLNGTIATAQTWPTQYGMLAGLFSFRYLIVNNSRDPLSESFFLIILALLPFIRIQFVLTSITLLFFHCSAKATFSKKLISVSLFLLFLAVITMIKFSNLANLIRYLKTMIVYGSAWASSENQSLLNFTVIIQYFSRYFITSIKIMTVSLLFALVVWILISLCRSTYMWVCNVSIIVLITGLFLVFRHVYFSQSVLSSELPILRKLLTWMAIWFSKSPHLLLYTGIIFLLINIFQVVFLRSLMDQKRIMLVIFCTVQFPNLYPLPDVGHLWMTGGSLIILTLVTAQDLYRKVTTSTLFFIRKLIMALAIFSFWGLSFGHFAFLSAFEKSSFWAQPGVFQGMWITRSQSAQLLNYQHFSDELNDILSHTDERPAFVCSDGFYQVSGRSFVGIDAEWWRNGLEHAERGDLIGIINKIPQRIVGVCQINKSEIDSLYGEHNLTIQVFGDSAILTKGLLEGKFR